MYAMVCTRPDLAHAVNVVSKAWLGSVRAGFDPFGYPTRAHRVCAISTLDE
jgi:hypothetical protein